MLNVFDERTNSSPVWPAMTMGCMMRVKSLSSTRWRKRTRGSKLEEDREMMLSFSSCSSLFSGIFSSLTRRGNVAPPSRAWQRVKNRSRWLSWCGKETMICYGAARVREAAMHGNKCEDTVRPWWSGWISHDILTCVCTDDTAWTSRLKIPLWLSIHLTGGIWAGSFYMTETQEISLCDPWEPSSTSVFSL